MFASLGSLLGVMLVAVLLGLGVVLVRRMRGRRGLWSEDEERSWGGRESSSSIAHLFPFKVLFFFSFFSALLRKLD